MKIGIVTVYNSYNCGSFLQATSLYKFLEKKGHQVCFIKRPTNKEHRLYHRTLMSIKYLLKNKKQKAGFILSTYYSYKNSLKQYKVEDFNDTVDLYIYGSDTIWNIHDSYFKSEWKRFWGNGISKKKIAYAPSVGATRIEEATDMPELGRCLSEFSAISVRDQQTMDTVKALLPKSCNVVQVLDPTMLMDLSYYDSMAKVCNEDNFVLVYAFTDLSPEAIHNIKSFAQNMGKKIIAFGDDFPADNNILFEPATMLSYYKKADYVFTNTFHGTVFSIIYNKEFASFGKNKTKVAQLLEAFNLSHRNIDCTDDIKEVMSSKIDYATINKLIEEKRKTSLEFLDKFTNNN